MSRVERDPERGRAAAARLRELGVKGILIKAAEQGYITQVACKMPECFCPEELGGACYFEAVSDEYSDWSPTHEHFPRTKREGGHRDVDNAILAHRLAVEAERPQGVCRSGKENAPLREATGRVNRNVDDCGDAHTRDAASVQTVQSSTPSLLLAAENDQSW